MSILSYIPIAGDIYDSEKKKKAGKKAEKARREAYDSLLRDLSAPAFDTLTSQEAQAYADPEAVAAQRANLGYLQNVLGSGGLTPEDRLQLAAISQQEQQQARGDNEAALARAANLGGLGGGATLGALMGNQQKARQAAMLNNLAVAAQAQQRTRDAASNLGQAGYNYGQQSFGQQAQRGRAADVMGQYNNTLKQQDFGNRANLASTKYGALTGNADYARQVVNDNAATDAAFRGLLTDIAMAMGTGGASAVAKKPGTAG